MQSIYISLLANQAEDMFGEPASEEELQFLRNLGTKRFHRDGDARGCGGSGSSDDDDVNKDEDDSAGSGTKKYNQDDAMNDNMDDFAESREMEIDKHEFMLLMIVRLRVVDTSLVKTLQKRFDKTISRIQERERQIMSRTPAGQYRSRGGSGRPIRSKSGLKVSLDELMQPSETEHLLHTSPSGRLIRSNSGLKLSLDELMQPSEVDF